MKSEQTIKAELESVERQTRDCCTGYGHGYKAALKFCLEPELPYKVGQFFLTKNNKLTVCVAHKPYAWWYFATFGENCLKSVRKKADVIQAFGGELTPVSEGLYLEELENFLKELGD